LKRLILVFVVLAMLLVGCAQSRYEPLDKTQFETPMSWHNNGSNLLTELYHHFSIQFPEHWVFDDTIGGDASMVMFEIPGDEANRAFISYSPLMLPLGERAMQLWEQDTQGAAHIGELEHIHLDGVGAYRFMARGYYGGDELITLITYYAPIPTYLVPASDYILGIFAIEALGEDCEDVIAFQRAMETFVWTR